VRPVAKCTENVSTTVPFPIPVSDLEDASERRRVKGASGADQKIETHSDAPLNKKQRILPASMRKTSSCGFRTMPPARKRPTAPQKPIHITRSTSSGTSASSSNLGTRKKVGFAGGDKPAVRATRVRSGGAGSESANESEW
jgi:hypothetical protein